jgi:hypothetical protein
MEGDESQVPCGFVGIAEREVNREQGRTDAVIGRRCQDLLTEVDTGLANGHAGSCDEASDRRARAAAEGTVEVPRSHQLTVSVGAIAQGRIAWANRLFS